MVLRLDAISHQISDRTVLHLFLWLQNEHERQFCKEFAPHPGGGRTTMMSTPVNRITSQCKIKVSQNYCPWINLQLWNFCHSFLQWMGIFFLIIMFCSAIHVYTDRFVGMGIIVIRPPWLRCEFLADCRSCSFSSHKQRCWTVLSELRYKIAYNPNTFFLSSKHIQQEKSLRMHCSASKCM